MHTSIGPLLCSQISMHASTGPLLHTDLHARKHRAALAHGLPCTSAHGSPACKSRDDLTNGPAHRSPCTQAEGRTCTRISTRLNLRGSMGPAGTRASESQTPATPGDLKHTQLMLMLCGAQTT
eukprot:scaffold179780_cov20-Tisochrysis_lutea.AAC.2